MVNIILIRMVGITDNSNLYCILTLNCLISSDSSGANITSTGSPTSRGSVQKSNCK